MTSRSLRTATELGHYLRGDRLRAGASQAELAAPVGVSRQWVIALEAGRSRAEFSRVMRVFVALGRDLVPVKRSPLQAEAAARGVNAIVGALRATR